MKTRISVLFAMLALLCFSGCASLSETGDQYRSGLQEIREGRDYFAIIYLKSILKDAPQSPYAPSVAFALGEYYYDHADYFNSLKTLSAYVQDYPRHKGVIFAKLIIYKIMTDVKKEEKLSEKDDALIKEIRKELFAQPLFLIFYDRKAPRSFKSLFGKSYLVYDYVDKIKVFRNDKIFLELSP